MTLIRSVIYGWLGAILAGLIAAIAGLSLGLPAERIAAAAAPFGMLCGALGLTFPLLGRASLLAKTARVER